MITSFVLIVEDEPTLAKLLGEYLNAEHIKTMHVDNGLQVVDMVRSCSPDLILLDLMIPGRDGMDVCRDLRTFSLVPIIIMTARIDEVDRLLGLDIGADDYICKPYSPREVVARVKAQLRRGAWGGQTNAEQTERALDSPLGPLVMDNATQRASVHGVTLDLTPGEFRLLRALSTYPGRVFSRDQLLSQLHGDGRVLTDRAVDSHIYNLRHKFSVVTGGDDPIRSVYGVGYAYEWPIKARS